MSMVGPAPRLPPPAKPASLPTKVLSGPRRGRPRPGEEAALAGATAPTA